MLATRNRFAKGRSARVPRVCFITGTGTGVGKTLLTALLVFHARRRGINALAVKPISSGDRADARLLELAQERILTLDGINPFHFALPVAPLVAARLAHRELRLAAAVRFIRKSSRLSDFLLVEGAGGWLTPLGIGFSLADLVRKTGGMVLLVAANELGVLSQTRCTLRALGSAGLDAVAVVISDSKLNSDSSMATNAEILAELERHQIVMELPKLTSFRRTVNGLVEAEKKVRKLLRRIFSLIDSRPLSGTPGRRKIKITIDRATAAG